MAAAIAARGVLPRAAVAIESFFQKLPYTMSIRKGPLRLRKKLWPRFVKNLETGFERPLFFSRRFLEIAKNMLILWRPPSQNRINKVFAEEEEYWRALNYSDIEQHKKKHQVFLGKISEYLANQGNQPEQVTQVKETIKNRLLEHIASEDKKFGRKNFREDKLTA